MSEQAPLTSFEQFVTFLDQNKVPHNVDREAQVVELASHAAPLPGNLYIRWEKKVPFIQVLHFMINDVPEGRIGELETALVRLNNDLEVGGFGFDYHQRRLYCRLTVPVFPNQGIHPLTLNQLGTGCVRNATQFAEAFQAVIQGKPGAEVIEVFKQIMAARAAKAAPGPTG